MLKRRWHRGATLVVYTGPSCAITVAGNGYARHLSLDEAFLVPDDPNRIGYLVRVPKYAFGNISVSSRDNQGPVDSRTISIDGSAESYECWVPSRNIVVSDLYGGRNKGLPYTLHESLYQGGSVSDGSTDAFFYFRGANTGVDVGVRSSAGATITGVRAYGATKIRLSSRVDGTTVTDVTPTGEVTYGPSGRIRVFDSLGQYQDFSVAYGSPTVGEFTLYDALQDPISVTATVDDRYWSETGHSTRYTSSFCRIRIDELAFLRDAEEGTE